MCGGEQGKIETTKRTLQHQDSYFPSSISILASHSPVYSILLPLSALGALQEIYRHASYSILYLVLFRG
jgi:hypothetical protein